MKNLVSILVPPFRRYVEAIDLNHNMGSVLPKHGIIGNNTTKQETSTGGRTTTRDLLVNAFSKTLPNVTNELITFCRKERDKIYRHKQSKWCTFIFRGNDDAYGKGDMFFFLLE